MMRRMVSRAVSLLAILQLLFCARIQSPPGGPPDTTPPAIINTQPIQHELNVPLGTKVTLAFSESIDPSQAGREVLLSPRPDSALKLTWKKNVLTIAIPGSLKADQTYVVTVKTGIKDVHRNALAAPFSLAFSTGASLDSGSISGKVFLDLKPAEGAEIWAFHGTDSLWTIFEQQPDYISETDKTGEFRLDYLAEGDYLCFAVQDKDHNRRYDPGVDLIGLPYGTMHLDSVRSRPQRIDFDLGTTDTTRLKPLKADFQGGGLVRVQFGGETHLDSSSNVNITLSLVDTREDITLRATYSLLDTANAVWLETSRPLQSGEYRLISQVETSREKSIAETRSSDTLLFRVTAASDTTRPRISSSTPLPKGMMYPVDGQLKFAFSEPVVMDTSAPDWLVLQAPDSSMISEFEFALEPFYLNARAKSALKPATSYAVSLSGKRIADLSTNALTGDSTYRMEFSTADVENFGSLSGQVSRDWAVPGTRPVLLLSSIDRKLVEALRVDDSLRFTASVPAGRYFFHGFDDRDRDGHYSRGRLRPPVFAEPLLVFPDTISVRARFETEGVTLGLGR